MVSVTIDQVSKSYDRQTTVLDRISLSVSAGELFFLLGSSGCGKTTLLRMVAGFIQADEGRILFDGIDISGTVPERRGLGMVFQNYALWPHMTVSENVSFGLDVRGIPSLEKRRLVEEVLSLVELPDFADRRIGELSGGQQQRVALARAIVVKPRVLLLDEPLSNLDARLRISMRTEIRRVCKSAGVTALYVTHDQSEALSTADRIALLVGGKVAQVGTPKELYEKPSSRAVAQFVGEANLISGIVVGPTNIRCAFATLTLIQPCPDAQGSHVTLCVRPERIRIAEDKQTINVFEAFVVDMQFLGASGQWKLMAPNGTPFIVTEPTPPQRSIGERLRIQIPPDDIIVLRS